MTQCGRFRQRGRPAREGAPLVPTFANFPFTEQVKIACLWFVIAIIRYRLPASQSLTKGFNLYACRRCGTFVPPKVPKSGLGQAPRPRRTGTPARNGCAVPKRGLNGAYRVSATHFYRLPRWSAEWRTTTPVPSSKEGNYRDRKKKLSGQRLLFRRKPKPE